VFHALSALRMPAPRSRLVAIVVALALVAVAAVQLLPKSDAEGLTFTQYASSRDSGAVDLNRDGAADYALYGLNNQGLSVGEQPSDGSDLRVFFPFWVSDEMITAVKNGGSAAVLLRVGRVSNLGSRQLVLEAYTGGTVGQKPDYDRSVTTLASVTPVVGRIGVDVTDLVRSMDSEDRVSLRLRLSSPAPTGGSLTQVNVAMSETKDKANRPVLIVVGASVTPQTTPTTTTPTTTTPTTTAPPPETTPTTAPSAAGQPPASVTGGAAWAVVFEDDFDQAAATAAKWDTGMRSGAMTLEGNTELQWYTPEGSTHTTDGGQSVLRQQVTRDPVPDRFYTVRTLCRTYPPASYPQYYNAALDNTCSSSNTNKTLVPYQFRSGMLNNSKSFGFRYGYVEARVKMPKGFGLWPALWMRDWQQEYFEEDIFEGFDAEARTVRTTLWNEGTKTATNSAAPIGGGDFGLSTSGGFCRAYVPILATSTSDSKCSLENSVDLSTGYHTIGFLWTPTSYEMYLDGVKAWTATGAKVSQKPAFLIMNLAFGNNDGVWDWVTRGLQPLAMNPDSFAKSSIEWDYVRVWQAPGQRDVCGGTGSCAG
jgi:beta-glucanase (GH16 family)